MSGGTGNADTSNDDMYEDDLYEDEPPESLPESPPETPPETPPEMTYGFGVHNGKHTWPDPLHNFLSKGFSFATL